MQPFYNQPYSTSCYGCYGGYSCYGVPLPVAPGGRIMPAADPFPPINPDMKKNPNEEQVNPPKEKIKDKQSEEQARAKVRIDLPEGGKLFVDGRHIDVAPGTRTFQTPPLAFGETYFYDIRIEMVQENGQIRREERRVIVRSGQEALVSFPSLRSTDTVHGPSALMLDC